MKNTKTPKFIIESNAKDDISIEDIAEPYRTLFLRLIVEGATKFYRDPENRKKYEEWHLKVYGEPYVWK